MMAQPSSSRCTRPERALHPGTYRVCCPTRTRASPRPSWRGGSRASSHAVRGKTCMYTMTPEEHFIVDRHPSHANVHFGAGFSGHGFKFAPVVGECLAGLSLAASHDTRSNFSASTSGRWARCRRRPSPRRWSCATRARSRRTLRKPRAASAFGSEGNRPPRHQRLRLRVERGARGHRSETCRQSQQHAFHATNTPDRPIDAAKTAGFAR